MFTDINLFKNDEVTLYEELKETEYLEEPEKQKKVKELNDKFKDKIRKYLPTCLNVINTNFGCQFSLYKVGKDFDSSFKVIETNVKKSKDEVEMELNNYKNSIDFNSLDDKTKEEIDLASRILITYVDGEVDANKLAYLEGAKAKASSIISNVPRMDERAIQEDNASKEIQYNPYANEPVVFDEEVTQSRFFNATPETQQELPKEEVPIVNNFESNLNSESKDAVDNTNFSMDIFYNGGQ